MALKLDSRQTRQRTKLDQLSTTTDLRLDAIMNLINDELTMPLRMRANLGSGVDGSPDQRLYIDSIFVKTLDSGAADSGHERSRTIPPIGGVMPNYVGSGYIEFNATTGAATASGLTLASSYSLPSMTSGQFVKVVVWLSATSSSVFTFGMEIGAPAASADAAVLPVPPSDAFALGYIVMTKGATTYSKVLNENIFQFVGGGGSGGGSGASKEITQANSFKVGNVVYYNGSSYVVAQANTALASEAIGMVSKASSTKFTLTELGYISGIDVANVNEGGGNLVPGEVYFLSAANAGKIIVTEPTTIGLISKPMLIADSINSGYVLNYRGVVIGGTNARTQVALVNNGSKDIQNISAYDAGQLMGWVYIAGTTNYRFHVTIQFSKNGAGSDYNVSYQTSGDTPPAGFNVDYNSGSSNVRVTLPLLAGFSSGVINYSLNGPAVGATFPLTIDGANVPAATASQQGTVSTTAQTFAGKKTLDGGALIKGDTSGVTIATGYLGENVRSQGNTTFTSTNGIVNVTTINITAGVWILSGYINASISADTTLSLLVSDAGGTSNTLTGVTYGHDVAMTSQTTSSKSAVTISLYYQTSVSKTIYLNWYRFASVSSSSLNYHISAVRIA